MDRATRLQPRGPACGLPPMWVIYVRPMDWPLRFSHVVRLWYGKTPTTEAEGFSSLFLARQRIQEVGGSCQLLRSPADKPGILEVWI
jgi:hypothetical protein